MAYTNIWEEQGLYRVFTGTTSGSEVLKSNLDLHGDARFDRIHFVLNDFTAIQDFEVSDLDISLISHTDKAAAISKPVLKIAIVTTCEVLLEWVHKYLSRMTDVNYACIVFDNLDEARKWCVS